MNKLLIGLLLTSSLTTIPAYSSNNNKRPLGECSPKVISDDDSSSSLVRDSELDSDDSSYSDEIVYDESEYDERKMLPYLPNSSITGFSVHAIDANDIAPVIFQRFRTRIPNRVQNSLSVDAELPAFVIYNDRSFHTFQGRTDLQKSAAAFLYLYYRSLIQQETSSIVRRTINHIFNTTYTDEGIDELVQRKIASIPSNISANEEEKNLHQIGTLEAEICTSNPKLYDLLCDYIQVQYWLESSNNAYVLFRTLNRAFSYLKKDEKSRNALKKLYNAFIKEMGEKDKNVDDAPYLNLIEKKLNGPIAGIFKEEVRWLQALIGKEDVSEDMCVFYAFFICSAIPSLSPATIEDEIKNLVGRGNLLDTYQNTLENPQDYLSFRARQFILTGLEEYRNPNTEYDPIESEKTRGVNMFALTYACLFSSTSTEYDVFSNEAEERINPIINVIMNRIFGRTTFDELKKTWRDKSYIEKSVIQKDLIVTIIKEHILTNKEKYNSKALNEIIIKEELLAETVTDVINLRSERDFKDVMLHVIRSLKDHPKAPQITNNNMFSVMKEILEEIQRQDPELVNKATKEYLTFLIKRRLDGENEELYDLLCRYLKDIERDQRKL